MATTIHGAQNGAYTHIATLSTISNTPTTTGLMRILRPNSGIATALSRRIVAMIGSANVRPGIAQVNASNAACQIHDAIR